MKTTVESYLTDLRGKRVAVIGIGVSNTPLVRMLLRADALVTACDKNPREDFGPLADELESLGATLRLGPDYLKDLGRQDMVFRTPGMHPETPQLVEAASRGAEITSEMEVFFRVCPCPIIGVTGSDGKTTTSTIIARLLEAAGHTVYLGGNIGKPLLPNVSAMLETDLAVVELSSFQLMTMRQSPDIAVVTNVAPNHLDIHKSMGEYVAAKENIYLHQSAVGKLVYNLDNDITRGFAAKAPGRAVPFSRREQPETGVFLDDGVICRSRDGETEPVLPLEDILLPGDHNVENYMAAVAAVEGLVPDDAVRAFAASFGGVEHRIELVRRLGGVRYYNDSIGTSPTRTIAGLRSFPEKVVLIAGGYDKHIPFDALGGEIVEHVRLLVLNGATADAIRLAVEKAPGYREGEPEILQFESFNQAVHAAVQMAEPGDVVLLSPACAAFDQFKNFAVRGEAFKKMIYQLEDTGEDEIF